MLALRVLDLTVPDLYPELGTSYEELVGAVPSRFILNARKKLTPTQQLGIRVLSQRTNLRLEGSQCPEPERVLSRCLRSSLLSVGERVAILDKSGRLKAEVNGWIPKPPLS